MEFQILDSLKSCLLKLFREEEHANKCQWLREAWDSNCDVYSAFIITVENCGLGWDQVRGCRKHHLNQGGSREALLWIYDQIYMKKNVCERYVILLIYFSITISF